MLDVPAQFSHTFPLTCVLREGVAAMQSMCFSRSCVWLRNVSEWSHLVLIRVWNVAAGTARAGARVVAKCSCLPSPRQACSAPFWTTVWAARAVCQESTAGRPATQAPLVAHETHLTDNPVTIAPIVKLTPTILFCKARTGRLVWACEKQWTQKRTPKSQA